jgi:hypothetical protein
MRWIAMVIVCAVVTGCASPEAARTRGQGAGADLQNRPADVKMHEGSQPFWETPVVIGDEYPELEPAEHARRLALQ